MTRQCKCCGIYEYSDICDETLKVFRGHLICSFCKKNWRQKEKVFKTEITLAKLIMGFYLYEIKRLLKNEGIKEEIK